MSACVAHARSRIVLAHFPRQIHFVVPLDRQCSPMRSQVLRADLQHGAALQLHAVQRLIAEITQIAHDALHHVAIVAHRAASRLIVIFSGRTATQTRSPGAELLFAKHGELRVERSDSATTRDPASQVVTRPSMRLMLPTKLGDVPRGRVLIDLARRADLRNAALGHHGDARSRASWPRPGRASPRTNVVPSWYCRLLSSNCVCSRSFLSSAASGSSSSSSFGRFTSARARATRCCWPPESLSGLRAAKRLQLHEREHLGHALFDLGRAARAPSSGHRRCSRRPSCAETTRRTGTSD